MEAGSGNAGLTAGPSPASVSRGSTEQRGTADRPSDRTAFARGVSRHPAPGGAPRIALYCGDAVGFPYWGYYAHALLSIGLAFRPVDAAGLVAGALDDRDVLVMPGGFATWGLDRAETLAGVDAAIRRFLAGGGAYLGSCGGAFYVSSGRPGWIGAIDATPRFTQEYLSTGAAMISLSVTDPVLGHDLPEAIEMPYYHGPAYSTQERRAVTLGLFRDHICPSRLFIDNPLDARGFDAILRQTPAILASEDRRVIAFSPHPEMGEFVRKGIALGGYIAHYLPIRGTKVMDETLRFYAKEDSPGFRLIGNAIRSFGPFPAAAATDEAGGAELEAAAAVLTATGEAVDRSMRRLAELAEAESDEMAGLLHLEFARLASEWREVREDLSAQIRSDEPIDAAVLQSVEHALRASVTMLGAERPLTLPERLVLTELPVRIAAAGLRLMRCGHSADQGA